MSLPKVLLGVFVSVIPLSLLATSSKIALGDLTVTHYKYGRILSTQKTIEDHIKLEDNLSPKEWILVSADSQDGGRGIWGRKWTSDPGNVFVTFGIPLKEEQIERLS